jgi:hypothetical protein
MNEEIVVEELIFIIAGRMFTSAPHGMMRIAGLF